MSRLSFAPLNPPVRLRALSDRAGRRLRAAWFVLFGLSILTVLISAIYAVNASYSIGPTIARHGLDFDVTTNGELLVGTQAAEGALPAVPVRSQVVAIDGRPVREGLVVADFARLLDESSAAQPTVTLRQPDGATTTLSAKRQDIADTAADPGRNLRIWSRLSLALLACATLLVCSLLLVLRRPTDPVAMLLAFSFVGLVATIDPPMQFWLWTDQDYMIDVIGLIFFYPLLLGLATFPNGVFVPRFFRWLIPLGIPLTIFCSLPDVDEDIQGLTGIAVLFGVVLCQIVRFRREPAGLVRQQIKWAGFGFAAGLSLIFAATILAAALGDDQSQYTPLMSLAVLVLFSTGMAVMALGLLVALIRFRLWEADRVITRSAAYAVVTVIVGVVWAASADLMKLVIEQILGRESQAGATTVGAIIAAGVFSPTQSVVLGWTRRRFGGPLEKIRAAAGRLKSWGMTETPEEVATRALAIIDQAVHPTASAILLDTSKSRDLIAARDAASADDPRLVEQLPLADDESSVGSLLIGRRSDGNRYNRQELEAIREIIPSLAEALRVARGRFSREFLMQQRMDEMARRLSQLEGGVPKPA